MHACMYAYMHACMHACMYSTNNCMYHSSNDDLYTYLETFVCSTMYIACDIITRMTTFGMIVNHQRWTTAYQSWHTVADDRQAIVYNGQCRMRHTRTQWCLFMLTTHRTCNTLFPDASQWHAADEEAASLFQAMFAPSSHTNSLKYAFFSRS